MLTSDADIAAAALEVDRIVGVTARPAAETSSELPRNVWRHEIESALGIAERNHETRPAVAIAPLESVMLAMNDHIACASAAPMLTLLACENFGRQRGVAIHLA